MISGYSHFLNSNPNLADSTNKHVDNYDLTVDVGNAPNDGNGDSLRDAFIKINTQIDALHKKNQELLNKIIGIQKKVFEITEGEFQLTGNGVTDVLSITIPNDGTYLLCFQSGDTGNGVAYASYILHVYPGGVTVPSSTLLQSYFIGSNLKITTNPNDLEQTISYFDPTRAKKFFISVVDKTNDPAKMKYKLIRIA